MASVKGSAQTPGLTSIPQTQTYIVEKNVHGSVVELEELIPAIDFSLLTSSDPDLRAKAVQDLGKACKDWGFFTLSNHGVPESLINEMIDACKRFFDMWEEGQGDYKGKHAVEPVKCGTSFDTSMEQMKYWRDFLKNFAHPVFQSPEKSDEFRKISYEYCKRLHGVAKEILKGISESLGLEPCFIEKAMNFDQGFQFLAMNMYPPCPQPDPALGMPSHSDDGLLTLLAQNGVDGFQLLREGKWVNVKGRPNSFMVNTSDHLEIVSNGRYKSNVHRAIMNSVTTRISIAVAHAPSFETVVMPAKELIDVGETPGYIGMQYMDLFVKNHENANVYKSCLDEVRLNH